MHWRIQLGGGMVAATLPPPFQFQQNLKKGNTTKQKYKKIQLHDILSFDFYLNRLLQREHTQLLFSQKTKILSPS